MRSLQFLNVFINPKGRHDLHNNSIGRQGRGHKRQGPSAQQAPKPAIAQRPKTAKILSELAEDNNMEDRISGSGPASLNSLSLSFPQQMSLSSSASGSGKLVVYYTL